MFLQLTVVKVKFKVERKERANLGFLLSYIGSFSKQYFAKYSHFYKDVNS